MPHEHQPIHCPSCVEQVMTQKALPTHDKRGQVHVDLCPRCRGVWLDGGELTQMLDVAATGLGVPHDATEAARQCPVDQMPMRAFCYPQTLVEIDMCPRCRGIWLDAREFAEIKAVRRALAAEGRLERRAPPSGTKGQIIAWINQTIDALAP